MDKTGRMILGVMITGVETRTAGNPIETMACGEGARSGAVSIAQEQTLLCQLSEWVAARETSSGVA